MYDYSTFNDEKTKNILVLTILYIHLEKVQKFKFLDIYFKDKLN